MGYSTVQNDPQSPEPIRKERVELQFRSLSEDRIGPVWKRVFNWGWPGWNAWYSRRLDDEPVPIEKCRHMIRRFMPGYERVWDRLVEEAGGDDHVARFLSFWTPPRYLANCSQLGGTDEFGPFLIRNYDLDPIKNEATVLKAHWHGYTTIGMVEGMAGLSDGINDAGLAISLTFGGRPERGRGFGIPLIMRYVLETCRDVQDMLEAFRAVPSHMSYNILGVDRHGGIENVMVAPDRPLIRREDCWSTNHQLGVEWPVHAQNTKTVERGELLAQFAASPYPSVGVLQVEFLKPPLHMRDDERGFATVFTAIYRPLTGSITLLWGDERHFTWSFDAFPVRRIHVVYGERGSHAIEIAPEPV